MIFVHDISPVFMSFAGVEIRWYGLLFAVGILLSYFFTRSVFLKQKYSLERLDSVVVFLFFGLVIGARLGEVFFYEWEYFSKKPLEILMIWNGGLSSHGAAIGLFLAYVLWCKIYKIRFSQYIDAVAIGMPIAAGFVRLGNFFNSEIVGLPTESSFGVVFARLGEDFARHPVQLYSAIMNFLVFGILFFVYKKFIKRVPKMFFVFLYVLLYFTGRFVVEFWKDLQGPIDFLPITTGQFLSVFPILIAVGYAVFILFKQRSR